MCIEVNRVFIQLPTQSKVTFVLPAGGPVGGGAGTRTAAVHQTDSSAKLRTTVGQERTYRGRCNRLMQVGCGRKLECMCELQSGELCCGASPSSHLQPVRLRGKNSRQSFGATLRQSLTSMLGQRVTLCTERYYPDHRRTMETPRLHLRRTTS